MHYLKRHENIKFFNVTRENRDEMRWKILNELDTRLKNFNDL